MKRVISSALLFSMFVLPVAGLVGCGEEAAAPTPAAKAPAEKDGAAAPGAPDAEPK